MEVRNVVNKEQKVSSMEDKKIELLSKIYDELTIIKNITARMEEHLSKRSAVPRPKPGVVDGSSFPP